MSSRTACGLGVLLGLGAVLRAVYLQTPLLDEDIATFGLQSRHILQGEFPVFHWGRAYMGTFQSFLAALGFALFGSSRLVLNAIPLLLAVAFILVTYRLGWELGGERVGLLAASWVALAPPYLAIFGAWARHGYMDTLLLGSLILLLAVRLTRRPLGAGAEVRGFAVLGLVGGLAWWTNFLSVLYLLPAALFLLLRGWQVVRRRGVWVALACFLLGCAPFVVFNLLHAFWSLNIVKRGEAGQAPLQLLRVVTEGLPGLLGARPTQSVVNYVPVLSEGVIALYAVAFAWLVAHRVARFWTRQQGEPGPDLLLVFLGSATLILAFSGHAAKITAEGTKRYLVPLYSILPLLFALFLARVREVSRLSFVALLTVPLALHLYGNLISYPLLKGEIPPYRRARAQDEELFRFLNARGLTRVYVPDFTLAPRLTFDAEEGIIFAQPFGDRHPPFTRLVDAAPRVAYLFTGRAGSFTRLVTGIGATFGETVIGPYHVYHEFREPSGVEALRSLSASGWRATASSTVTPPALAFDRDVDSSWYSGEPQRSGQFFQVDLGQPTRVGKVVLLTPRPSIGFPHGYRVELSRDGRRWEETAAIGDVPWSLDWAGGHPRMEVRGRVVSAFEPREVQYLRIQQTGSDPRLWWAIGELFVYGPASSGPIRPTRQATDNLERGRAYEAHGRLVEAIAEYSKATHLDPELEVAHARLAFLYERAGIPLDGAPSPGVRAMTFEQVGLWAKAAREYEKEMRATPHQRYHTDLWRRLLRAYREAGAQGEAGEEQRARMVEEQLTREFAPAVSAAANFDDEIQFLGYRLEPATVAPGRTFHVTYYWQSRRPTKTDYTVFVHFTRGGRVVFQRDHSPLNGAYPTSRWQAGEVVREEVDLVAPEGLEAGTYEMVVGIWDEKTGRHLRVKETALPQLKKDRVVVASITVGK